MTHSTDDALPCWIYRSNRRNELYLYLAEEDGFDAVPEALRNLFGPPQRVMELQLTPTRTLAREDVIQVMKNLREQGFHLQMPPVQVPERADA